jgi:hypothetical protein
MGSSGHVTGPTGELITETPGEGPDCATGVTSKIKLFPTSAFTSV